MRAFGTAATVAILFTSPFHSAAASTVGDQADIASCIRATAAHRPWLEKTLWGLYDQERGRIGAAIANRNGTYDLGPLQVNSLWVPRIAEALGQDAMDVRRWLRDDACFNVGVASWIFLNGYHQTRDYWLAVGAYHSSYGLRGRLYASRVADHLRSRYGSGVFFAGSRPVTPDRQDKQYLALEPAGAVDILATLRNAPGAPAGGNGQRSAAHADAQH